MKDAFFHFSRASSGRGKLNIIAWCLCSFFPDSGRTTEDIISSASGTKIELFCSYTYFIGRCHSEQRFFDTFVWEAWLILQLAMLLSSNFMLLIFFFSIVQKWTEWLTKNRQTVRWLHILNCHGTRERLKFSLWKLERKLWVTTLRSHNFFYWLHNPISTELNHNVILLL